MGHPVEFRNGNKVRQEQVRDAGAEEDVDAVLDCATEYFSGGEGGLVDFAARWRIAINKSLDPAKNMVEKNGLRARPAAPKAAKQGCDEKKCEAQARDQEKEQPQVLEQEGQPEEVEFLMEDIQKHRWGAVDLDDRKGDVDRDQNESCEAPESCPKPPDIGRMHEVS